MTDNSKFYVGALVGLIIGICVGVDLRNRVLEMYPGRNKNEPTLIDSSIKRQSSTNLVSLTNNPPFPKVMNPLTNSEYNFK